MGPETLAADTQFVGLRKAYEDAFHRYAQLVRWLNSLTVQPGAQSAAIEEARRAVEQAQSAYREKRDALAHFVLSRELKEGDRHWRAFRALQEWDRHRPESGDDRDLRFQVERLAYSLWEQAGRPLGNPEEHWYRAERLIRNQPTGFSL